MVAEEDLEEPMQSEHLCYILEEPVSAEEAFDGSEGPHWLKAAHEELKSMEVDKV